MKPPAGRILAVDPGTVRIGLAVSDELGVSLTPLEVVEGRAAGEERVAEIAVHEGVAAVVVGLPLNMTGTAGREAAKARRCSMVRRTSISRTSGLPVTRRKDCWPGPAGGRRARRGGWICSARS